MLRPGDRIVVVGPAERGEVVSRYMLAAEDGGLQYKVRLDDGTTMLLLDHSVVEESRFDAGEFDA